MLPEENGINLCSKLRQAEETSHIPIVMLSSYDSKDLIKEGIDVGADDYFSKPIDISLLKARIRNLLNSRKLLQEHFFRTILRDNDRPEHKDVDTLFIEKASGIVEQHMRNEEFDVELFAKKIGMSRVSLYRKLKTISGLAPNDFIKSIRLRKATELLGSGQFSVGETMEEIGMLDMSYFCKVFKKEHGIPPSEFRKSSRLSKAS